MPGYLITNKLYSEIRAIGVIRQIFFLRDTTTLTWNVAAYLVIYIFFHAGVISVTGICSEMPQLKINYLTTIVVGVVLVFIAKISQDLQCDKISSLPLFY